MIKPLLIYLLFALCPAAAHAAEHVLIITGTYVRGGNQESSFEPTDGYIVSHFMEGSDELAEYCADGKICKITAVVDIASYPTILDVYSVEVIPPEELEPKEPEPYVEPKPIKTESVRIEGKPIFYREYGFSYYGLVVDDETTIQIAFLSALSDEVRTCLSDAERADQKVIVSGDYRTFATKTEQGIREYLYQNFDDSTLKCSPVN